MSPEVFRIQDSKKSILNVTLVPYILKNLHNCLILRVYFTITLEARTSCIPVAL